MLRQSQEEPESTEENVGLPVVRNAFHALERDAPSTEMSPEESADSDLPLFVLQHALSGRRKALPALYRKVPIFTALALLSCGMIEMSPFGLGALWLLIVSPLNPFGSLYDHNRAVEVAVAALADTEDPYAIGPLVEALNPWASSYPAASAALCRLLPLLQPADSDLLNERQRASLRRALKRADNPLLFWRYDPIFADTLQRALTTLDGQSSEEQAADTTPIESYAPDVEALLQMFQDAVRQRQKNTTNMGIAAGISAVTAVVNLFTMAPQNYMAYSSEAFRHDPVPHAYLLGTAFGALGLTLALSCRGLFRLKGLMKDLADVTDLRLAGPLIEIVAVEDSNAKLMAVQLLKRLLPRFRASDVKLLTEAQHATLLRILARNDTPSTFFVAALKALEQIGDARALPVVQSLANGRRATTDPTRVQAAAQDCLPFLQIRCDQQRASQTLLRASSASDTSIDTLLLPAQGVGTTDASELLRAGTSHSENQ